MKHKLCVFLTIIYTFILSATGVAAPPKLSEHYVDSYLTSVAAASCLGVYLPGASTEFDYLRSYGWQIYPQNTKNGKVETNFVIAKNYFPDFKKNVYLVTFRGSASKGDWVINLKTDKVNFGGTTLEEMHNLTKAPLRKNAPAVHEGFNEYVDTVLQTSVLNDDGSFRGVFGELMQNDDAFLILSGHSLGGAAATLLGERLVSLGVPREKFIVVTFGAPAIGNKEFAEQYGDKIHLLRITNTADPIPGSLQTFFGGYKQFGKHIKYNLSTKISSVQHDMAMYFDYSINEVYKAFDEEVAAGRLYYLPDTKVTPEKPVVALWINADDNLKRIAGITDVKRFMVDEYKKMLPSYVIMDKKLPTNAYERENIVQMSRYAGADYVLICGVDGKLPRNQKYWYLNIEQALFDRNGNMLSMAGFAKKVAPAVGNIQAAGECLEESRKELHKQLPFVQLHYSPSLTGE